jgi:hypothetical protein
MRCWRRQRRRERICRRSRAGFGLKPDHLPIGCQLGPGLPRRHRQLVASGRLNLRYRQGNSNLLPTHTADFGPDLEFLGPGSSALGSSDMIVAETEEVVDLIVG